MRERKVISKNFLDNDYSLPIGGKCRHVDFKPSYWLKVTSRGIQAFLLAKGCVIWISGIFIGRKRCHRVFVDFYWFRVGSVSVVWLIRLIRFEVFEIKFYTKFEPGCLKLLSPWVIRFLLRSFVEVEPFIASNRKMGLNQKRINYIFQNFKSCITIKTPDLTKIWPNIKHQHSTCLFTHQHQTALLV